tara:strand:- start:3758 stop:7060 length:3303 start_codon:yes stop_codon:yes gene_type:complete
MGGVAGHMDHLYDNRSLTFAKMKEILKAAADAELTAEEKVDGQNLFLSYSIPEGKAKGARNKGNLMSGGLDAEGLATKFAGRGGLTQAFTGGFAAFEKAVEALSDEEKEKVFGSDANIWYNAEIMDPGTEGDSNDPGSVNVIKYDNKTLKIHGVGHFRFDKETGERRPIPNGSLEIIDNSLERMQDQLSDNRFNLARKAIIQLQKMEDEEVLKSSIEKINREISQNGLSDDSTMTDYLYSRLFHGLDTELPDNMKDGIVKYLLKLPGNIGLRALKKGLNPQDLQDLNNVINSKKSLLQQAIEPLEIVIHDFAVELLKGLDSVFIADTDKEVIRLRDELATAVRELTAMGPENPAAMEVMQRHLNKIKDFSQITTPVEAVVFDYDGHTYKFSGNFAPLNQILGMFKFGGRTSPAVANESISRPRNILTEDEGNIKREKAKQFVLSLPKFVPTEAWGDPESMERKQIQKIFDTVGGGATIQEKLQFLNDSINNPRGGIRSPRRIISTLILLESLSAVIRSFNSASAGFVFEGFLSALFRGKQEAEVSEKGNLPIQDLIAFSELEDTQPVPISLKLLNQKTKIEGSYTNLVDSLEEFGQMVYIVARKDGDNIALEKFTFTRDNFINAIIASAKGGTTKDAQLFALPYEIARTPSSSIKKLNSLTGDSNWPEKYKLLQMTKGYRNRKKTPPAPDETVTVSDELPDGTDIEPQQLAAHRIYSVEENKRLISEGLLLERAGGTQWAISPQQLKAVSSSLDYETLGTLPITTERVVDVAEQYMEFLSDNLQRVFEATSKLSENVNDYFTYQDRSQAIGAGQKAIEESKVVADEMSQQISQDSDAPGQRNESVQPLVEEEGKRIALFPGKFKPPHKGHYEFVNQVAKRSDVDNVMVLISPVDKPEVSAEQSLEIWSKFLSSSDASPKISVEIADYRSPVTTVYEFLADPVKSRPQDTILLIKSSKDEGDTRFQNAKSYAERHNPGISVEEIEEEPVTSSEGQVFSAEDIRDFINLNKKDEFLSYMPDSVDGEEIWRIFKPTDQIDSEIDAAIEEMATMAGGAVEGGGNGFAPGSTLGSPGYAPASFPKKRRKKSTKPKVNRPKRQRRR